VCQGCRERDARIAELEGRILALEGQVRDLSDKIKPPPPKPTTAQPPAPPKKVTGRKPGGQIGHPPHLKTLLPPERVTEVVTYIPKHCQACGKDLPEKAGASDPEPTRFQVIDLPPLVAQVTEHQGHARTCPAAAKPLENRSRIPFVRMRSIPVDGDVVVLGGNARGRQTRIEEIAESVFCAPIALARCRISNAR